AEDARAQRLVVIKRILPHYATNPDFVQFFIHEGRLGQRLRHPNLVETIEAGQVGDACYITLEYLRGQPAIELLRQAARAKVELPLGAAVRIVADAARGLHHAHTAVDNEGRPLGVVHRDVTPHNLFLCTDGKTKVLDFGIAMAASQLHQTRTGTIKGKFAYLAPEQIRGEGIDRRVDVFALGIVLHELLTLRPLFRGANDAETLNRVLTSEVPAPENVRRGVPPGLGAVALRALQRDRDRRLPSAEALANSIEAVAIAEGIDASHKAVADLLNELCPRDSAEDAVLREHTPPHGEEKLNPPSSASMRAIITSTAVTTTGPALDIVDAVEDQPDAGAEPEPLPAPPVPMAVAPVTVDPVTEPAPPPDPIIELRHPKAVPALSLADVVMPARDRHRALAGRAALVVGAAAALALAATHAGSCAARFGHTQALTPASSPGELTAPRGPSVPPMLPASIPSPEPPATVKGEASPPLGAPPPQTALVPAGEESQEAILRVQVEGQATFVVDGRSERSGPDGAVHLSPGHHRVVVSSPMLAYPRTLEVDLRPRELATRAIARGRGTLRVAVTPWAEVTVDGRVLGVTPLAPVDLAEGAHQVSLKNGELGVVAKRRIIVSPNKESLLKLDLFGEKK
ncbi:MAG TPA: protein kinase, partial [Polyangia bacterium]|nr:protein kinase [Polyangia bacterium]